MCFCGIVMVYMLFEEVVYSNAVVQSWGVMQSRCCFDLTFWVEEKQLPLPARLVVNFTPANTWTWKKLCRTLTTTRTKCTNVMKGVFFIGESPLKSHAVHLLCSIKYEFFIHFGHKGTFLFLFFCSIAIKIMD